MIDTAEGFVMIDICVAGALGRMGRNIIEGAEQDGYRVVGAVETEENPSIGKTLRQVGIGESDVRIDPPSEISRACGEADVYISFTTPDAELSNLPLVAETGTDMVVGTTGFTAEQLDTIHREIGDRVTAVFAPNFALGVNLMYRLVNTCGALPDDYDFSITEVHHNKKQDAPSGTAERLAQLVSESRGYTRTVCGREGFSPRKDGELEVLSVRTGGVPGIHDLIIAGPDEMIKIEHISFSRRVFAQGALYAARWAVEHDDPGVFSLDDVLGWTC